MSEFLYISDEIERPELFRPEKKDPFDQLLGGQPIEFSTGPLTREMFEEIRKQIEAWPIVPDRESTYETIDGVAHITNAVGFRMMMPEADFREHFMGDEE